MTDIASRLRAMEAQLSSLVRDTHGTFVLSHDEFSRLWELAFVGARKFEDSKFLNDLLRSRGHLVPGDPRGIWEKKSENTE